MKNWATQHSWNNKIIIIIIEFVCAFTMGQQKTDREANESPQIIIILLLLNKFLILKCRFVGCWCCILHNNAHTNAEHSRCSSVIKSTKYRNNNNTIVYLCIQPHRAHSRSHWGSQSDYVSLEFLFLFSSLLPTPPHPFDLSKSFRILFSSLII